MDSADKPRARFPRPAKRGEGGTQRAQRDAGPRKRGEGNALLPFARPELEAEVERWLEYLGAERRYSPKTLEAYARDVRQLLAFSRKQTLRPQVLDLGATVEDLTMLLRRLLGEKVTLETVHGRDLWPVKADVSQLEQVVVNLAVNARDAMPNGGKLTVRTANITEADSRALPYKPLPSADSDSFVPGAPMNGWPLPLPREVVPRLRWVRPKSQSTMSCPPRYHSSVQAKMKRPAPPDVKIVRICPAITSACSISPLPRLSNPISAITSGRSPARF